MGPDGIGTWIHSLVAGLPDGPELDVPSRAGAFRADGIA